ncbi:MAG: site-specific integrase [Proteobacteria bacterium]|nr:site-specific integrase [Pseudomonadota bacterium]
MPRARKLPIDLWPAADRDRWQRATVAVDFFDVDASAAHWSTKTRYQAQAAYGRWLSYLTAAHPAALRLPAAERTDRVRVHDYVVTLADRITAMSIAAELGHLILALRNLAPDADWTWLRQWQYRYEKAAVPREKRHKMVHPSRLIELGRALMDGADARLQKIDRACQYRDGLLIALLAYRPLRRRSLAELRLTTHLRPIGSGYVLALQNENTKAGLAHEFPVPEPLVPYLTRYLECYRLLFPHQDHEDALWLSAKGGALTDGAIYLRVCRRTRTAFGTAIHPHLFRDIAATTIAREAPESLAVARDLLTHADVETTLRHYTQARTIDAARQYAAAIDRFRHGAKAAEKVGPPGAFDRRR